MNVTYMLKQPNGTNDQPLSKEKLNLESFVIEDEDSIALSNFVKKVVKVTLKLDNSVVLADGVISPKEEQFFYRMKDILQLPDID